MPLRPFTVITDGIPYTANRAVATFPVVPKGSSRNMIVGIRGRPRGANAATIGTWSTLLAGLVVGGRQYVQGDPFPLALLDGGAVPLAAPFGIPRTNKFLGTQVPLPWGDIGAGIAYNANDEVRITLERFDADSYVDMVTLDCVQFPDDPADPINAIYERARSRGIGEPFWVGSHRAGWPGAGAQVQFEVAPQPPTATVLRRTGARGAALTAATGSPVNREIGPITARTFNNLTAQLFSAKQRAAQNGLAPARAVLGLPGYDPATGIVDLTRNERSTLRVQAAGTSAANNDTALYFVQMFEGRDESAPILDAADAIS
jgi:hypothetical protein